MAQAQGNNFPQNQPKNQGQQPNGGFQSKQAQAQPAARQPPRRGREVVKSALVQAPERDVEETGERFDPTKEWEEVVVTPMQSILRTRIGNKQNTADPAYYTFQANVRVKVPRCVARHLAEKGIIPSGEY